MSLAYSVEATQRRSTSTPWPGHKRLSAPPCTIMLGSIVLPSDLDILRPAPSNTNPCVASAV